MPSVLVVGGGPAGLSAAETLLREGPRDLEVILLTDREYVGGKAASWSLPAGLVVENGQHITMGFYRELPALLARAGVDHPGTTVSNGGHFYIWEDRDQQAHYLHLGQSTPRTVLEGFRYTGWSLWEKMGFMSVVARAIPGIAAFGVPESWDDICLSAWCAERGLPASIFETNAFRATRDAQLNWPGEISAYSMLKTIQRAGRDFLTSEARFPAGGMSRIWWEPLVGHLQRQGGVVNRLQKLVALEHDGRALTGLRFAPQTPGGPLNAAPRDLPCPSEHWQGFDAVILCIPPAAVAEVLAATPELAQLPGLAGIARLRPVCPLGLHVWHRQAVQAKYRTVLLGLPAPLEFLIDNKSVYPEYRDNPGIGAALHFVGQETGWEHLDDQALLERALASARRVAGYEQLDLEGVIHWQVVRNRAPCQRYWNAEPGSLRLKPQPETPVEGLYLAGDWVRSELDFASMETAVYSGRTVAQLVLERRFFRRQGW